MHVASDTATDTPIWTIMGNDVFWLKLGGNDLSSDCIELVQCIFSPRLDNNCARIIKRKRTRKRKRKSKSIQDISVSDSIFIIVQLLDNYIFGI